MKFQGVSIEILTNFRLAFWKFEDISKRFCTYKGNMHGGCNLCNFFIVTFISYAINSKGLQHQNLWYGNHTSDQKVQ